MICKVCLKEFTPHPNARPLTCSKECGRLWKKYKDDIPKMAEAKERFSSMDVREWTRKYLCKAVNNGGYKAAVFDDNNFYGTITNCQREIDIVKNLIKSHPHNDRLSNHKDKFRAWLDNSQFSICRCGNPVRWHTSRGWQQYCSMRCSNDDRAKGQPQRLRINETRDGWDAEKKAQVKYNIRNAINEKYGMPCLLACPKVKKRIHQTRIKNGTYVKSKMEIELTEFIKSLGFDVLENDRDVIDLELDIVIPSVKVAIELNGVVWHSEKHSKPRDEGDRRRNARNRHRYKVEECEKAGYHLIQIWSDEYNTASKRAAIHRKLKYMLGKGQTKHYARKLNHIECSSQEVGAFLNYHHIQGSVSVYSKSYCLGDEKNELQAVMLFTKRAYGYELVRFASNGVVGAFGKLLKAFRTEHPEATVVSFGDRCLVNRNDNIYIKHGFREAEVQGPDYSYTNGGSRHHKFGFRKDKMVKRYPELDMSMTEAEMTEATGWYKVWNAGLIKYVLD